MRCGLDGDEISGRIGVWASTRLSCPSCRTRRPSHDTRDRRARGAEQEAPRANAADLEKFGRKLFESLWRLDFVARP